MEITTTEEMKKRSIVNKGNMRKIADVMEKAIKGEDITVGFLGGSITQGCHASVYENCYVNKTYLWFKNKFKNSNVKCINAGVGATGSILGVHRVYDQLLKYNPDIVFVEFAVNDKTDINHKVAYDSLIRRILSYEKKPALIELFLSHDDGTNVQDQQGLVGKKYNISMISYRDAIWPEIEKGNRKLEDFFSDEVHPNNNGHKVLSDLNIYFLEYIFKNLNIIKDESVKLGEYVYGDKYSNGTILNSKDAKVIENIGFAEDEEGFQTFHNGWKFVSGNVKEAKLKVEIEAKNIFIAYKKSVLEVAPKLRVKVDGQEVVTIDTYFKDGWGDCSRPVLLCSGDNKKTHEVEVTIVDEGKEVKAYILGFLAS